MGMASYHEVVRHILADQKIDDGELKLLCDHVYRNGAPSLDDVRLLVELYTGVASLTEAFEDFFYGVLKKVILSDGEIQPGEQFYLLKVIYSDRVIRPRELAFLRETLRHRMSRSPLTDAKRFTRELEKLYRQMWGRWCAVADRAAGPVVSMKE